MWWDGQPFGPIEEDRSRGQSESGIHLRRLAPTVLAKARTHLFLAGNLLGLRHAAYLQKRGFLPRSFLAGLTLVIARSKTARTAAIPAPVII